VSIWQNRKSQKLQAKKIWQIDVFGFWSPKEKPPTDWKGVWNFNSK